MSIYAQRIYELRLKHFDLRRKLIFQKLFGATVLTAWGSAVLISTVVLGVTIIVASLYGATPAAAAGAAISFAFVIGGLQLCLTGTEKSSDIEQQLDDVAKKMDFEKRMSDHQATQSKAANDLAEKQAREERATWLAQSQRQALDQVHRDSADNRARADRAASLAESQREALGQGYGPDDQTSPYQPRDSQKQIDLAYGNSTPEMTPIRFVAMAFIISGTIGATISLILLLLAAGGDRSASPGAMASVSLLGSSLGTVAFGCLLTALVDIRDSLRRAEVRELNRRISPHS